MTNRKFSLLSWSNLLWSSLVLLLFVNGVQLFRQPLQVDVAWYLYVGKQILLGKRLYVDVLENNPPLICFLNVIPNWFAVALHLDVKLTWIVFASSIVAISVSMCLYFLNRIQFKSDGSLPLMGFLLGVVCVVPFVAVFGERDHLAFVALLPLLCLAATRIAGKQVWFPATIMVSLWSGIFLALKPFFLVAPLLCLLFTFWHIRKRIFSLPEFYIVPAVSFLHLLFTFAITPEYFEMARLAARWYGGYDVSRRAIAMALAIPAWAIVLSGVYRSASVYRFLIRLSSLATMGWILSAILQHKGNDYHILPAFASAMLLACLVLLDLWKRGIWKEIFLIRLGWAGPVLFAVAGFYAFAGESSLKIDYFNGSGVLLPALQSAGHQKALFLSTALVGFPVVNETKVEFGNAYPCLWLMPGFYKAATRTMTEDTPLTFHSAAAMPADEHELFNRTFADLAMRPKLIIVDAHKYKWAMGPAIFDFETYFKQDDRIRKLWSDYHELAPVKDYRIYERKAELSNQSGMKDITARPNS